MGSLDGSFLNGQNAVKRKWIFYPRANPHEEAQYPVMGVVFITGPPGNFNPPTQGLQNGEAF